MALSRASSVMTIVETGIRKDFMGHVIVLIYKRNRLQDRQRGRTGGNKCLSLKHKQATSPCP